MRICVMEAPGTVLTVLIAEDDENDRFLIERVFEKAGGMERIAFACDGQETIEFLEGTSPSSHPALLLLDIRMPRMDGFQVLEWLQNNPSARPPFVVILSSSSDPRDMERAFALGADGYRVKPHNTSAYVNMVQEFREQLAELTRTSAPAKLDSS